MGGLNLGGHPHGHDHDHSHDHADADPQRLALPGYRRALWVALVANAVMAVVEVASGLASGSLALLADAVDFAGDAVSYGLSLAVLGMALRWRSTVAWLKGWSMAAFGAFVLARAAWALWNGHPPEPLTMGVVGTLALLCNLGVALLLYRWREGDANMRAVWLCTRNDALANLAVLGAAGAVSFTGRAWPDLLVAAVMATLALSSAREVLRRVRVERAPAR